MATSPRIEMRLIHSHSSKRCSIQLISFPGGNASHRGLNGSEQSDALLMMHLFKDGLKHCAGSASIEKEVAYAL